MNAPTNPTPNPSDPHRLAQALDAIPPLPGQGAARKEAPSRNRKSPPGSRSKWTLILVVVGVALAGGIALVASMSSSKSNVNRADLLLHTVKLENLDLTVVERGTLESAENKDVVCQVKASKGASSPATTIKWVIDDGTYVKRDQLIAILDSAALEDQFVAQRIVVDQARALSSSTEQNLEIVRSQNRSDIETAKTAIELAELDLEKYLGLPAGTIRSFPTEQGLQLLLQMERDLEAALTFVQSKLSKNGLVVLFKGEFQQLLDDVSGRIDLAEADLEMWKDRSSYSQRMQLKGFLSAAQVQADESRLASAVEALKKVRTEKDLLQRFAARRMVKDLSGKLQEAWRAAERVKVQANAKEIQAQTEYDKNRNVADQEFKRLLEIEEQIRACKIIAPQDGMVVYYVPEQARFGSGSQQSIIAQGEPVREGQRLMRIPDLKKMQVMTRVHEAMISRIRGDDRKNTGFSDALRAALLINRDGMSRLLNHHEEIIEEYRDRFRNSEYILASEGQSATLRVEAFADRRLKGHVRSVATVAAQQDWSSADVKVYQTIVSIDESLSGLKPGMSAEVTIHVENTLEDVPAIPVQSVIGGAESGRTRTVWVMTPGGPESRDVVIGLANDKLAEVKSGLQVGDQVIINPKVLLGDKIKTFEPQPTKGTDFKGGGKGGKGKGGPPTGPAEGMNGGEGKKGKL